MKKSIRKIIILLSVMLLLINLLCPASKAAPAADASATECLVYYCEQFSQKYSNKVVFADMDFGQLELQTSYNDIVNDECSAVETIYTNNWHWARAMIDLAMKTYSSNHGEEWTTDPGAYSIYSNKELKDLDMGKIPYKEINNQDDIDACIDECEPGTVLFFPKTSSVLPDEIRLLPETISDGVEMCAIYLGDNTIIYMGYGEQGGLSTSAAGWTGEIVTTTLSSVSVELEEDDYFDSPVEGILDGIAGVLTLVIRLPILAVGNIVQTLTGTIANLGGSIGIHNTVTFNVAQLFFNEVPLTRLDFFDFDVADSNNTIVTLRTSVAQWYYILRNIALVILLGILIYVGIRMAISTVASEEAKYKKMLENWFVSIVLLFLMHYIIIFILTINNSLVSILSQINVDDVSNVWDEAYSWLYEASFLSFANGWGATLVYVLLAGISFIFLLSYIKRMITVAFLIMISPLIVITYSIDKMGDGKSQALNTWLKEFSYNVLIQPFHCIIYLSLSVTGIKMMSEAGGLGGAVFAIIMLVFIWTAEKIVKNIFGFRASSLADAMTSGAIIGTALGAMKKDKKSKSSEKTKAPTMSDPKDGSNNSGGGSGGNRNSGNRNGGGGSDRESGRNSNNERSSGGSNNGGSSNRQSSNNSNGDGQGTYNEDSGGSQYDSGNRTENNNYDDDYEGNTYNRTSSGSNKTFGDALAAIGRVSAGIGLGAAGAMLGLATGNVSTALIGFKAGYNIPGGIKSWSDERKLKRNQKHFAAEYKKFAQSVPQEQRTKKNLQNISEKLLDVNSDDAEFAGLNNNEKEYWQYLHDMKQTYVANGAEDPDKAVMNTIKAVQSGRITPHEHKTIRNR